MNEQRNAPIDRPWTTGGSGSMVSFKCGAFMADAHEAKDRRAIFADLNIWSRIEWSKTTRGGRQFDLLQPETEGCKSSYGLCE